MLTKNWIYKIMHHLLLSDLDKEFLVHKGKSQNKVNIMLDCDINGNLINFSFFYPIFSSSVAEFLVLKL